MAEEQAAAFRPTPRAPAEPFEAHEVSAAWIQPVRMVDLVLASADRIAASVERGRQLAALGAALFAASVVFALPYGLVLGGDSWWRIATLYLGSTLVCLPSLYVFASYLGQRIALPQVVVLALTIPAVAAAFTLGFAPILGFLRATMNEQSSEISPRSISVALLSFALVAGVAQLWRCLVSSKRLPTGPVFVGILLGWHVVFGYVLLRMARVLGLDG